MDKLFLFDTDTVLSIGYLSAKHLVDILYGIYKGLWEIEESFKIIKSEFKAHLSL
ncbi:MAG: hypothetical protein J6P45_10010 [Lachnospiraceae bacterium]|nr:hypothetical protein [Lachnospiraceae bacterium]